VLRTVKIFFNKQLTSNNKLLIKLSFSFSLAGDRSRKGLRFMKASRKRGNRSASYTVVKINPWRNARSLSNGASPLRFNYWKNFPGLIPMALN